MLMSREGDMMSKVVKDLKRQNIRQFSSHRPQISLKLTYSETTVKMCLLIGSFYHPETRKCQIPFEEANCQKGQWLSVLPGVNIKLF